jgi:hypothetical protein
MNNYVINPMEVEEIILIGAAYDGANERSRMRRLFEHGAPA